jgi:putative addiction module killer protein
MLNHPRRLEYFERVEGDYPFRDWFMGIKDPKTRHRLKVRLRKLEMGNPGSWRALGAGVIELKEDFGPGYRIYVGEDGLRLVILLAGGTKSSQGNDIQKAKAYWASYLARKRG